MEKERKNKFQPDSAMPEKFEAIKNVEQLKELYVKYPNAFRNEQFLATDDGNFMFVNGKFIRLDKNYRPFDFQHLAIPTIGYEPHADRAIVFQVKKQQQFSADGMYLPSSYQVRIQGQKGIEVINKERQRFFVVKAGVNFSRFATGREDIQLRRGDEIILADYLDGIAKFPEIDDPTGAITNTCISFHYSEVVGYVLHRNDEPMEFLKDQQK